MPPAGPPPKKSKGLLIAGLIVGAILVLALIVGGGFLGVRALFAASDPSPDPSTSDIVPSPSPTTTEAAGPEPKFRIGDCLRQPTGQSFDTVDCEQSHYGQVYAQKLLEGDAYPGEDQIAADAQTFCMSGASGALDPAKLSEEYGATSIFPTAEQWAAGERHLHCVVVRVDGSDFAEDLLPTS